MNELPTITAADIEAHGRAEFDRFDNDDAVELGLIAVKLIQEKGVNLAVDIVRGDDLVFRAKLGKTGPGNDEWLRGKAACARLFGIPSLLVRRREEEAGRSLKDLVIDHTAMKPHGGAIPIFVAGELVATITMSGEPDVIDHEICAAAVARYRQTLKR
jgi:uncharacterized protein (UPF0303 family)